MNFDSISIRTTDFLANADVVAPDDPIGRLLSVNDVCHEVE